MESTQNTGNKISGLSKGFMVAFAISLLVTIYLLFTFPADLRFKGNLPYLDLVIPVLIKLYASIGITLVLAFIMLYAEMKNTKVAIVYKEKSASQIAEEKTTAEATKLDNLDSKTIAAKNPKELLGEALNIISKRLNGVAGACYLTKEEGDSRFAELISGFALPMAETDVIRFNYGEGMVGQVAKSGTSIYIDDIPEGYFQVVSGLGQASPKFIFILPVKKNNEVKGILEVATFQKISDHEKQLIDKFASEIGERLN
jgi:methyl-accepting chemotaxis protein